MKTEKRVDLLIDESYVLWYNYKYTGFLYSFSGGAEGKLSFARIIERDDDVLNWLRLSSKEFNITYNHGKNYEPDFVVETENTIYLVEVKVEKDLNDPDVIAKKKRGILYCETVTHWSEANGYKPWMYLFIPANHIYLNSTFNYDCKEVYCNKLIREE